MIGLQRRRRGMMGSRAASDILWETHNHAVSEETINTNLSLFETDIDWSIAYDISVTAIGNETAPWYVFVPNSSGSNVIFRVIRGGSGGGNITIFNWLETEFRSTGKTRTPYRLRFVITHTKNSGVIAIAYRFNNESKQTGSITKTFSTSTNSLRFGQETNTRRLPTGTLNHIVIYNRVLSSDEIDEFMEVQ